MDKTIFNIAWSITPMNNDNKPFIAAKTGRDHFDIAIEKISALVDFYYRTPAVKKINIEIKELNADKILVKGDFMLKAIAATKTHNVDLIMLAILKRLASSALSVHK